MAGNWTDDSVLRRYFHDIASSTPLSREKEVELAARIRQGDVVARNELVQANLGFVIDVAGQYQHYGLSLAELISAGNAGLMEAAERFDGERGFKFISYAVWWIRQAILLALAEESRATSMVEKRLDAPRFEDEDAETLASAVADQGAVSPIEWMAETQAEQSLSDLIHQLPAREREIVKAYFGLGKEQAKTLKEIGDKLGLTQERVSQLKERALRMLYGLAAGKTVTTKPTKKKSPKRPRKKKLTCCADVDWEYLRSMPEFRSLYGSYDEFMRDCACLNHDYSVARMIRDRKEALTGVRQVSGHTIRRVRMYFRAEGRRRRIRG